MRNHGKIYRNASNKLPFEKNALFKAQNINKRLPLITAFSNKCPLNRGGVLRIRDHKEHTDNKEYYSEGKDKKTCLISFILKLLHNFFASLLHCRLIKMLVDIIVVIFS